MKKYKLEISETQAKIISLALDVYSRLEGGQLENVFRTIAWKRYENLQKAEPLLKELQQLLTGMQGGSLGIGQVSNAAQVAYDLHQVIRHRLAWDRTPAGGQTVNFDTPTQMGDEPLAKIALLDSP